MEHQTLIEKAAADHGLPARLVAATVGVESGGNTWAFRFESGFYQRYVKPNTSIRALGPCSLDTERQAQATSWGLMQVMGATARSLGFAGPFLSALCVPETGLEFGARFLAKLRDRHLALHGWPGVVCAYNAGSVRKDPEGRFANQAYVDRIAQALGGKWPE